jgi:hypothetical protein
MGGGAAADTDADADAGAKNAGLDMGRLKCACRIGGAPLHNEEQFEWRDPPLPLPPLLSERVYDNGEWVWLNGERSLSRLLACLWQPWPSPCRSPNSSGTCFCCALVSESGILYGKFVEDRLSVSLGLLAVVGVRVGGSGNSITVLRRSVETGDGIFSAAFGVTEAVVVSAEADSCRGDTGAGAAEICSWEGGVGSDGD